MEEPKRKVDSSVLALLKINMATASQAEAIIVVTKNQKMLIQLTSNNQINYKMRATINVKTSRLKANMKANPTMILIKKYHILTEKVTAAFRNHTKIVN